jgi:hypothetical protein
MKRIELNFKEREMKDWLIQMLTNKINDESCEIELNISLDIGGEPDRDKFYYTKLSLKTKQENYSPMAIES